MFFTVYILTNREGKIFYVGISGSLEDTVLDHKAHIVKRNSWRHCTRLVYYKHFEEFADANDHLEYVAPRIENAQYDLIRHFNPCWTDLSSDWWDPIKLDWYKRRNAPVIPFTLQ